MKNWGGNAIEFLKKFGEGIGDFFLGPAVNEKGEKVDLYGKSKSDYFNQAPKWQQDQMWKKQMKEDEQQQSAIPFLTGFLQAEAPRFIRSGPPPNVINKAPHIDSPFMDRWYKERELLRGPQLFPLASNPVGDSVPIKPFETNKGVEWMPYPYGPVQNFPKV